MQLRGILTTAVIALVVIVAYDKYGKGHAMNRGA